MSGHLLSKQALAREEVGSQGCLDSMLAQAKLRRPGRRNFAQDSVRFAIVLLCLLSNIANAAQDDWFGPDKALHASLSAAIAGSGYALGVYTFEDRGAALLVGSGLALGAGVVKELVDWAGHGQPSAKDLAWDAIGTLVGLALAYSLDLLIRSSPPQGPPLLVPTKPVAIPGGVVIRF